VRRSTDAARAALRDAIAALERTQGEERAATAPALDHLRASLRQLDRLVEKA
jgi:predicted phage gp36 major capsid-like protein